MGRTLSGASYDRNDYVLQPHNGGSGCASVEELKERYGMIRENEFNTPGGVLAYDEKGNVPTSSLPSQILTRPSTYIKGAVSIVPGGTSTYKISNYNESTAYNVSFNGGTATITGDTITITAGNTAGVYELVINNEKYQLAIATSLPRDVNISTHALLTADLANVILSIKTDVTIDNGANHFATDYQVATDEDFQNVVFFEQMSPNKTEARFVLSKQSQYFIRARAIDSYKQKSEWSNVTSYDLKNIGPVIGTPSTEVRLYKDGTDVSVVIEPSSFYSETGQELNYAEVKVYSDPTLTTEVASGQWTDITKPYTFKFTSATENLYTVFRHVSKSGVSSYWSKELYKKASELFSTMPVVRRAHFLPDPAVDNTNSYISRQSYMSPNGKWAIVPDGIRPVAYIYNKDKNGKWILESTLTAASLNINSTRGFYGCINNEGNEVVLCVTIVNPCVNIIKRINNVWTKVQSIDTSSYSNGTLGSEIDISYDGKWLFTANDNAGVPQYYSTAYYFKRNAQGLFDGPFAIENPTGSALNDAFGNFGVFNEQSNRLVITALREKGTYTHEGSVYIFKLVNENWVFEHKFTPASLGINVSYDYLYFGYFVRTKQDRIFIGVQGYCIPGKAGVAHGAVAVLRKNAQSWELETLITYPDEISEQTKFGYNFDVNDSADRLIIGSSPSSVSIYGTNIPPFVTIHERVGNLWSLKHKFSGINPGSIFGRAVNISADGKDVLICSRGEVINSGASRTGSVAFYSTQEKKYEKRYSIYVPSSVRNIATQIFFLNGGEFAISSRMQYRDPGVTTGPTGAVVVLRKVNGIYSIYRILRNGVELSNGPQGGYKTYPHPTELSFFVSFNPTAATNPEFIDYIKFNPTTQEFDLVQKITVNRDVSGIVEGLGTSFYLDSTGNKLFVGSISSVISGKVTVFHKENGLYVLKYKIDGATELGLPVNTRFGNNVCCNADGSELIIQSANTITNGVTKSDPQLHYFVFNSTLNKYEHKRTIGSQELGPYSPYSASVIRYSIINKCWYTQNTYNGTGSTPRVIRIDFINNEPKFTTIVTEPVTEQSIDGQSLFAYHFEFDSNDTTLAVGAPNRSYLGDREGSIHVFKKRNNVWKKEAYIPGLSGYAVEQLGVRLAVNSTGNTIISSSQMNGSYSEPSESNFFTVIE